MRRAVLACTLLLLSGCGTLTSDDVADRRPASEGEWRPEPLTAEVGADAPVVIATDGDDALVVTTSEEGSVRSSLSTDGQPFETGPALETGLAFGRLAGAVPHGDGWYALVNGGLTEVDGDGELLFETRGLRSDDGLTWSAVDVTGFTGPADVGALAQDDGVMVAGGAYREDDDPSMGGFRPVVWRSEDGVTWTESPLPEVVDDGESTVSALAVHDGRFLATGHTDGHGMLWTSDDGGRSWQASTDPAVLASYGVRGIAADDGVVVVVTEQRRGGSRLLRSTDGGDSFAEVPGQPPASAMEGWAPLYAGGGRFLTTTSRYLEAWRQPETCYADVVACQQDSVVALYASDDGAAWSRVDTSGIGDGEAGEVDQAVGTADGRVLTTQWQGEGVLVHTWPADVDLPVSSEPVDASAELTEVPESGVLEPGVRYHAPLYVHCGMDWLYLGDQPWQRTDDGADLETGAGDQVDPSWPVAQQTIFGFATLTGDDVVEYSIGDGEVIATYEQTGERPPGCD